MRGSKIDAQAVFERVLREGPDALLSRGEAAALVAARVKDGADTDKTARNRVGTQLDRARAHGGDVHQGGGLAGAAGGCYTVDEMARWASREYKGMFDDLPTSPREFYDFVEEKVLLSAAASGERMPGNLKDCQTLVEQLRDRVKQMEADQQRIEDERKRKLRENFKHK